MPDCAFGSVSQGMLVRLGDSVTAATDRGCHRRVNRGRAMLSTIARPDEMKLPGRRTWPGKHCSATHAMMGQFDAEPLGSCSALLTEAGQPRGSTPTPGSPTAQR